MRAECGGVLPSARAASNPLGQVFPRDKLLAKLQPYRFGTLSGVS